MFEPIGGSAPKYTGQNVINPLAAICAGQMMLDHLGEREAAAAIENGHSGDQREYQGSWSRSHGLFDFRSGILLPAVSEPVVSPPDANFSNAF